MKSEFEIAITQLCSDRNVSPEVILEAIEAALVSAYKRNYGPSQNVSVTVDRKTGQAQVFVKRVVVEDVSDEDTEISLAEARACDANAEIGGFVDQETKPRNFGRIAAQTAKQVIMQRIREAERDSVYLEYADRVGELANGVVRNVDARTQNVTVSLGKAEALLPKSEQIPGEFYRFNQRLRVYLSEVARSGHGPQIMASRAHRGLLRRLLELEVPEIFSGTVEIKAIAREAGSRSKVAVAALQAGIDPVGSCVGMRGVRIQNIVNELNGEKIDVVPWSPDMEIFIANALSPARVVAVRLNEETNTAKVVVPDNSLSLAIGKEGQNARLAAKLTGWRIDIRSETEAAEEARQMEEKAREEAVRASQQEAARRAAAELLAQAEASLDPEDLEEPEVIEGQVEAEAELPADQEDAEETVVVDEELAETVSSPDATVEVDAEPEPAAILEPEAIDHVSPVSADATSPDAELADAAPGVADPSAGSDADESVTAVQDEGEAVDVPVAEGEVQPETAASDDEEDDDDETEEGRKRKALRRKGRSRVLEYDERLGEVVARRKRKRDEKWRWDDDEF